MVVAALAADVNHAVLSVMPAVLPHLRAFEIKYRYNVARGMQATLADDVHHAALSMLLAVHRPLAALDIVGRRLGAGAM